MRVLLTDANSKNSLAALRSLAKVGHEVGCLGPKRSISHSSEFCSDILVSEPNPDIEEILRVLELKHYDVVIPVGARSVELLNINRDRVNRLTRFALPKKESLDLALNKFFTQELAHDLGIFVPPAKLVQNLEQLSQAITTFRRPFVIRSVSHRSNSSTLYVHTEEDVEIILRDELANPLLLEGPVQLQEYVEGWGEGFFALYQNGHLVRYMTHKRLREFPRTGGSSWAAASTKNEDTYRLGRAILDNLAWHGPAMIEFKRLTDGTLAFVELNPKLWGSLDLTLQSGVDIPRFIVDVALGQPVEPSFTYKDEVVVWWPFDNLVSLAGGFGLRGYRPTSNIRLDDLKPHLIELSNLIFKTLMNLPPKRLPGRLILWFKEGGPISAMYRFINEILGLPIPMNSKIDSLLWVGAKPSKLGALILTRLMRFEIYSLLKPSGEESHPRKSGLGHYIPEYLSIETATLSIVTSEIVDIRRKGKKVYLHCREGVGRAPTVAAAVLVAEGAEHALALSTIRKLRPTYNPTAAQSESLRRFFDAQSNSK